jgi:hypothetical protein
MAARASEFISWATDGIPTVYSLRLAGKRDCQLKAFLTIDVYTLHQATGSD